MSDGPQILIDGFYCAYRSAFAFKDFRTKAGQNTGLIFGFIRTLQTIAQKWPDADMVVCWDTPSTWRREAYDGYKRNRTRSKGTTDKQQLYATADFCRAVGIEQALSTGHEADDVIGSMVDKSRLNIIYSRDRDFCQLVDDGVVVVYSPKTGNSPEIIFDEAAVVEKYGVHPRKLVMYRALKGDSSDNLPGLRRFPSKKIVALVQKHESVADIVNTPDSSVRLTDHQKTALAEFQQQGPLNYRLMKILTDIEVRHIPGQFDRRVALKILDDFELKSLRSTLTLFEEQGETGLMGLFDS